MEKYVLLFLFAAFVFAFLKRWEAKIKRRREEQELFSFGLDLAKSEDSDKTSVIVIGNSDTIPGFDLLLEQSKLRMYRQNPIEWSQRYLTGDNGEQVFNWNNQHIYQSPIDIGFAVNRRDARIILDRSDEVKAEKLIEEIKKTPVVPEFDTPYFSPDLPTSTDFSSSSSNDSSSSGSDFGGGDFGGGGSSGDF